MSKKYREVWDQYVSSWKLRSPSDKMASFENCLAHSCQYIDPFVKTKGWEELTQYMLNFHEQIPNTHFVTTDFLAHHDKSVAKWEMTNDAGVVLSDGISYAEYNDDGKLTSIIGFYETP